MLSIIKERVDIRDADYAVDIADGSMESTGIMRLRMMNMEVIQIHLHHY